jgi:DeoR/GlpR family transcriptional regulator of sugar metabolism
MSLTELTGNPRHDQLLMLISERGYMNIDELAQPAGRVHANRAS